jgi:predicted dienelactone hydrolase
MGPADLAALSIRGPHPVGVRVLAVRDPRIEGRVLATDVWYPAEPGEAGRTERAEHPFGQPHDAIPEARPAPGPHPVVVFSHGNSGLRRQSTFLTTHLASHGFLVAAPDHAGNTFFEMLGAGEEARQRIHFEARRSRPGDLALALEAALGLAGERDAPLADPERIGALGHSFGGWTALKLVGLEPRVRAVCGLAAASEPFVGRKAFAEGELPFDPPRPVLLVSGVDDVLVDLATSTAPLFARLAAPRALVGVRGADHFHFCDGIELLHGMHERNPRPAQPRPTRAGAELLPPERMHRLLRGLVAAFFRAALAGDPDPCAALAHEALAAFDGALARLDGPGALEEALRWQAH